MKMKNNTSSPKKVSSNKQSKDTKYISQLIIVREYLRTDEVKFPKSLQLKLF